MNNRDENFLLQTDSYKPSHIKMQNPDITTTYAYLESRGGPFDEIVFFGLQYYLTRFEGQVFSYGDVLEAQEFWSQHFGRDDVFDADAWYNLYEAHGGTLPLKITSLAEGSIVPPHTPLLTVENTDPDFAWLPMYIEPLLMKIWAPISVATQSHYLRKTIRAIGQDTSDDINAILDFMVHDFGYRGVSSEESARILGAGHLLSFKGTDNVQAIRLLQQYYDDSMSPTMYGFSVPASEHSIILGYETENDAFQHILDAFPEGIVACVSDTYNIYEAVQQWGTTFHDQIMNRKGRLVVRPDSGNPLDVVPTVLRGLRTNFGGTTNSKSLWVLPDFIRVIQGDGMNVETIPALYQAIITAGFAPDNLIIGSGGGLLQQLTRDTLRMAYKPSEYTYNDGRVVGVSKSPITDKGKTSQRGRFSVVRQGNDIVTVAYNEQLPSLLTPVFENGTILRDTTFEQIRQQMKGD